MRFGHNHSTVKHIGAGPGGKVVLSIACLILMTPGCGSALRTEFGGASLVAYNGELVGQYSNVTAARDAFQAAPRAQFECTATSEPDPDALYGGGGERARDFVAGSFDESSGTLSGIFLVPSGDHRLSRGWSVRASASERPAMAEILLDVTRFCARPASGDLFAFGPRGLVFFDGQTAADEVFPAANAQQFFPFRAGTASLPGVEGVVFITASGDVRRSLRQGASWTAPETLTHVATDPHLGVVGRVTITGEVIVAAVGAFGAVVVSDAAAEHPVVANVPGTIQPLAGVTWTPMRNHAERWAHAHDGAVLLPRRSGAVDLIVAPRDGHPGFWSRRRDGAWSSWVRDSVSFEGRPVRIAMPGMRAYCTNHWCEGLFAWRHDAPSARDEGEDAYHRTIQFVSESADPVTQGGIQYQNPEVAVSLGWRVVPAVSPASTTGAVTDPGVVTPTDHMLHALNWSRAVYDPARDRHYLVFDSWGAPANDQIVVMRYEWDQSLLSSAGRRYTGPLLSFTASFPSETSVAVEVAIANFRAEQRRIAEEVRQRTEAERIQRDHEERQRLAELERRTFCPLDAACAEQVALTNVSNTTCGLWDVVTGRYIGAVAGRESYLVDLTALGTYGYHYLHCYISADAGGIAVDDPRITSWNGGRAPRWEAGFLYSRDLREGDTPLVIDLGAILWGAP